MKNNMIGLFVLFQLIAVCTGLNRCQDYQLMYSADGLRSSGFNSSSSSISLCDAFLEPETWYRFDDDAGTRLIQGPIEPWFCGTQAPIWIDGSHPKDKTEVTVKACATYSSTNLCGWNGTVHIQLCNESGSEYYVYLLAVPPGCPLAYCIDAASHKQCVPPQVWRQDEFKCGVAEPSTSNSPVPPTETASTPLASTFSASTPSPSTPSASIPSASTPSASTPSASTPSASTPPTERQSSTTTPISPPEPPSSGWSDWGPWSVCSKPCDYGYQSSRKTCSQLPCEGQANNYQLCNQYNCQKIPEEKAIGIVVVLQDPVQPRSIEDAMLKVVMNQQQIHEIFRSNINKMCSQSVSLCCGWQYTSISPLYEEFVTSSDIYPSQGRLEPKPDYTVYYQLIAVVNEDIDRTICNGRKQRRNLESNPNFVSLDVLKMACFASASSILNDTGLVVNSCMDPTMITEDDNEDHSDSNASCPPLTCLVPIAVCITVAVVTAVAIVSVCLVRMRPKPPPKSETPEPPAYEEIASRGSSVYLEEHVYTLPHVYNSAIVLEEPVDVQKGNLYIEPEIA